MSALVPSAQYKPAESDESPKPQCQNWFPLGQEVLLENLVKKELSNGFVDQQKVAVLEKARLNPREAIESCTAVVDIMGIVAALMLSVVLPETYVDPAVCSSIPNGARLCNLQVCMASFSMIMCFTQIALTSLMHGCLKDIQEDEVAYMMVKYYFLFRHTVYGVLACIAIGFAGAVLVRISIQSSQYESPYWEGEEAQWWSHPAGISVLAMLVVGFLLPFCFQVITQYRAYMKIIRSKYGVQAPRSCCSGRVKE
uniref:Uncharacterized protein n=1 Tax=Chromera velia CCMP2878 TaxID=1169474 RepID=A0A0G4G9L2_9ALVE|eukprot:Cvel_20784.t1-p1 / transcript=Cvel_20784.t1 / gene=Cvel_20784 / organism=Chromera_velia_CCMP2878 / gene_product=hypothetical protein / transcript_product=hypothetical protein / location=Cvel_scaffold1897:24443-25201(-) / protein_length=253 / sequence_SO=supercontig / SO=protein_coding / is_pseudo=false